LIWVIGTARWVARVKRFVGPVRQGEALIGDRGHPRPGSRAMNQPAAAVPHGPRVLVAEDNFLIGETIRQILVELGRITPAAASYPVATRLLP